MSSSCLQKRTTRREAGFSLVELMVALTIFSIVMTLSISTLLVLIDANAKAQALSSAMTNVTFALDSMTRNLRTGANFHCTSGSSIATGALPGANSLRNCPPGSNANTAVVFTPGADTSARTAYRLNGTRIEQRIDRNGTQGSWVPITSDQEPVDVTITTLRFVVEGVAHASSNDVVQPWASFLVKGYAQNGLNATTPFEVQSRITQRILDY